MKNQKITTGLFSAWDISDLVDCYWNLKRADKLTAKQTLCMPVIEQILAERGFLNDK